MAEERHAVTGAYGYSGRYIATRLLAAGKQVITLTNSVHRANPFGDAVPAYPFNFTEPAAMAQVLEGVDVLYNTYWVRFNHKKLPHADAVQNSLALFEAARQAGVRRIVHISITNPSKDSPLSYFRGKAELEEALASMGLSHAILRPAVLFGEEDILINNIAWALRHMPVLGVFGRGDYRLQPIHVDDLAALAVAQGEGNENTCIDALGPETFTYRELVHTIAAAIGKRAFLIPVPPAVGYWAGWIIGQAMSDVFVTRDEITGLMSDLLCTDSLPTGTTALSAWVQEHAGGLGRHYASELARRKDRHTAYKDL